MALALVSEASESHGYKNPIHDIWNIGDPSVFEHNGGYFLYPTSNMANAAPANIGIRCWYSQNLVDWEAKGWPYLSEPTDWGQNTFFGPEVHSHNGVFLMFYGAAPSGGGPSRICVAQAASPLGPFKETKAPLFADSWSEIDAHVFVDDDGKTYLYWTSEKTGFLSISAQQIDLDTLTLTGSPAHDILGAPFLPWEVASFGLGVNEAAFVIKHNGTYYLLYSGNVYNSEDYAVGYATATSPLGPYTKSSANPILKKNLALQPPVSGPGSAHVVSSPDGAELFIVYHVHKDAANPSGERRVAMDRLAFQGDAIVVSGPTTSPQPDPSGATTTTLAGSTPASALRVVAASSAVRGDNRSDSVPFTVYQHDTFTTGEIVPIGSPTGWSPFQFDLPDFAWLDYDSTNTAYRGWVTANRNRYRVGGGVCNNSEWMPYQAIGSDKYVRAKYYLYAGGQADSSDSTQLPNLRVRVAARYAVSSILEVFHHLKKDPAILPIAQELRPSIDPEKPSLYRVDLDLVDVPTLAQNPATQGVLRAFEAYAVEPQENGFIALTECVIGTYPVSTLPDSTTSDVLVKVFQPSATDAGDLQVVTPTSDLSARNLILGTFDGDPAWPDTTTWPTPTYAEAGLNSASPPPGITFDSTSVPLTRIGIIAREFFPGGDARSPSYLRVEEGKQYKIRWHVTSTQQSNLNSQMRMRGRSVRWSWSQKYEVGGAWAAGPGNNAIAQQALPGVGCLNPDKAGGENGGWYTMLMHTPMSVDIRPEFAPGTPLAERMPNLSAQPGPGVNTPSRRDLRFGFDLLDTITTTNNRYLESGNFTVDRIEVRVYDIVED
jgi:GH43 family beta-xylosidase